MPSKLAFPGTAHATLYDAMQSQASEQARLEQRSRALASLRSHGEP